jgi:hypothetical protein
MNVYRQDYQRWLDGQIALLRAGRLDELDVEHLIEEMEEMGIGNRRALSSHLIILIAHLLKWQFQPEHRCSSWRGSIIEQRVQIEDLLETAPSLKRTIPELVGRVYPKALKIAIQETGIAASRFPRESPFGPEQLLDGEYYPEP